MSLTIKNASVLGITLALLISLASCASAPVSSGAGSPQTVPQGNAPTNHPEMAKIKAVAAKLKPTSDTITVFYYRADGDYTPWGFWLWAMPGGDGAVTWTITQNLQVLDGVAYLTLHKDGREIGQSPIGEAGSIGLIRRADDTWDGQTGDMEFNTMANGNLIAYFEDTPDVLFAVR